MFENTLSNFALWADNFISALECTQCSGEYSGILGSFRRSIDLDLGAFD